MSDREDFYDVLAVDRDASRETIERAYRERVRELHPDVSQREDARERFKRVTHAKQVLTDRRKRAHYDRMGHEVFLERERRGRTDRSNEPDADGVADQRTRTVAAGAAGGSAGGATTAGGSGATGSGSWGGSLDPGASGVSTRATRGASTTDPSTPIRRRGGFAIREALAGGALAAAAAGGIALALVPPPSHYAVGILVASWLIVSAIAGVLAGAVAPRLPAGSLSSQAVPAALLVAAPLVAATTIDPLVALALAIYGGYAAVFRTAALVAARWRSPIPPAAVWFVAMFPAAAVVFATRVDARGIPGRLVAEAVAALPPVGTGATLAVVVAVAVAAVHAVLRLGRRAWRPRGI